MMTQKEIAQALGVSTTGYAGWEQGLTQTDFDMLLKIADFYEVSLDYLLGRSEY